MIYDMPYQLLGEGWNVENSPCCLEADVYDGTRYKYGKVREKVWMFPYKSCRLWITSGGEPR
jgi:hypothetical protein